MLKRLFGEFADSATPAGTSDPLGLTACAARMHKLKGSAGNVARSEHIAKRLGAYLQRMRESAAPAFEATLAQAKVEEPLINTELEPQLIVDLVHLLHRQSLSAVDRFNAMSPQLRRRLDQGAYERVRDHIDKLRFDEAAKAIECEFQAIVSGVSG